MGDLAQMDDATDRPRLVGLSQPFIANQGFVAGPRPMNQDNILQEDGIEVEHSSKSPQLSRSIEDSALSGPLSTIRTQDQDDPFVLSQQPQVQQQLVSNVGFLREDLSQNSGQGKEWRNPTWNPMAM